MSGEIAGPEAGIARTTGTDGDGNANLEKPLDKSEKEQAAAMIQRNYRGYKERREMRGIGLSASTRWDEALKELRYRESTRPLSREKNASAGEEHERARRNWKKIGAIAERAGADDSDDETVADETLTPEELEEHRKRRREARAEREKTAKQMDLQYWLEMVDQHHRYGSNLRAYHGIWQKANTHENFFYWLDHGEGRNVEVPMVPRSRLDSEKVRYLSREERQKYLATVDKEGRLCWAHNGMRITTSTAFKDSVDGIVPRDDIEHQPWATTPQHLGAFSSDESSTLSTGAQDDPEAHHYVNHDLTKAKGISKLKHVSPTTILNHLLQKSVKPNSWIFVADTSDRLYIGIKQSGAFQHSSFLHGSRISAAGLIKIKDGQLRRLSPLSGHYRPPTRNFRLFVHSLKERGVDMSRVSISRSYAVLVGLEMYVRTRRKLKHGVRRAEMKGEKVVRPEEVRRREEEERDKSESAERERRVLREEGEKKRSASLPFRLIGRFREGSGSEEMTPEGKGKESPVMSREAPLTAKHEDAESGIPPEGTR